MAKLSIWCLADCINFLLVRINSVKLELYALVHVKQYRKGNRPLGQTSNKLEKGRSGVHILQF